MVKRSNNKGNDNYRPLLLLALRSLIIFITNDVLNTVRGNVLYAAPSPFLITKAGCPKDVQHACTCR